MSFLLRRHLPWAWAGWRDLDAAHARANENPIQPPWRRTNNSRTVWLESNVLKIQDYSETPMALGGVSFEHQPFTPHWGAEFGLNIDGNIIQEQFFGMSITSSWTSVAFTDIADEPMIAIHRGVFSATNAIQILVYHALNTIETLASTGDLSGLMNRSWYTFRLQVDMDRLIRVYINDVLRLQYWLPEAYTRGPGKRALNFLNQTSAWSEQKNYRLYDRPSDFEISIGWLVEVIYDSLDRANGAVANGWTVFDTAGQIVSNSYATTGTTAGTRAIIRNTGVSHGTQRVEAHIGGAIAPNNTAYGSLILRTNSTGTTGLAANVFAAGIYISRYTGAITAPTMIDYDVTETPIVDGDLIAFSANGDRCWVEVNGEVVLLADLNGGSTPTNSWAGLSVGRLSSTNSASWRDARILVPF